MRISLFIATSLDGDIAKPNDDLSFLKLIENEGRKITLACQKKTG